MDKKGILELKRRMTKDGCTFTKMTGCYVDGEKNKIVNIDENFLGLEEEEFYKYLEIAKKTLSGTIGNNLMEYEFPLAEEEPGGHQQSLMAIKSSQLKNEEMLESFYDMVIENYEHTGNYLILLFHDVYDVMTKTTDNNKLDESEEIFEYIICSICPVALSKPGLGYRKDENRIGTVDRDWIVGLPESGFLFPAFTFLRIAFKSSSAVLVTCIYFLKSSNFSVLSIESLDDLHNLFNSFANLQFPILHLTLLSCLLRQRLLLSNQVFHIFLKLWIEILAHSCSFLKVCCY